MKLTLCRAGFDVQWLWAGGEEAFRQALEPELDLILADYSLPHFNARQALLILREQKLDVPCIVITGAQKKIPRRTP